MAVRGVFFDFGGTLVSPLRDGYPVFEEVFRSRHVPLDRGAFARAESEATSSLGSFLYQYLGKSPGFWDSYHALVLEHLGVTGGTDEMIDALHEAFTSPRWHRPYPETAEVLDELTRRAVAMHVVSNNTELLPETISKLGWSTRFASVTYSQEAGAEKPDPRLFRLALERAGCRPSEVVHVGDSWEADVLGATKAGLRAIWLNRQRALAPKPCETVTDLRGVIPLLSK